MIVGVTGTRRGMTARQAAAVSDKLRELRPTALHHGDCVGVDAEVHEIAMRLGIPIVIHPPVASKLRAHCEIISLSAAHWDFVVLEPMPYVTRDHDIVDACDLLIACPRGPEHQRSGTWTTVRYARHVNRPIDILEP